MESTSVRVSVHTDSANDSVSPSQRQRTASRVRARSVGQTFICGLHAAARLRPPQGHSLSRSADDIVRRRFHLRQGNAVKPVISQLCRGVVSLQKMAYHFFPFYTFPFLFIFPVFFLILSLFLVFSQCLYEGECLDEVFTYGWRARVIL